MINNKVIFVSTSIEQLFLTKYFSKDDLILPAIKRGDLFKLISTLDQLKHIIIVDGLFDQTRSITHKEILWAQSEGFTITGISSMGALRAYELRDYGVLGYGKIYQDYCLQQLDGDDEVAISFFEKNGIIYQTIPMVNIRETFRKLNYSKHSVIEDIRKIDFRQRTWAFLKEKLPAGTYDILKENYVDQKKLDVISFFSHSIPDAVESMPINLHKTVYIVNDYIECRYSGLVDFIRLSLLKCNKEYRNELLNYDHAISVVNYLNLDVTQTNKISTILSELNYFTFSQQKLINFSKLEKSRGFITHMISKSIYELEILL